MTPRIKMKQGSDIETRSEMEKLVGVIVGLQSEQNKLKIEMDEQISEIKLSFEGNIDYLSKQIDDKVAIAERWAASNPDEFGEKKSIDFVHAVVGYRLGTPKVQKLKKFKSFAAVAKFMANLPWAKKYLSYSDPTVDKDALIRDRKTITAAQLSEIGLAIVQDETFFISPKTETLEQGVTL